MDLFTMPKIVTEHMYMLLTNRGAEDGRKFRDSLSAALGTALLSPTVVPQAFKPLVEVYINYDFFRGKPLVGTYQQGLEVERQFNDSTSEIAKLLGKTGMVSPIAADHVIRGMLGSMGGLGIMLTNPILHSDPDVPKPTLSFMDAVAALPGTSGFVTKDYENSLKNDFYVLRDEVEKANNTFTDLKKRSPDKVEEYLSNEKNINRVGLHKTVTQIANALNKIRQNISYITNAPESQFTADQKQQQIKELREMEAEILKSVDVKELRKIAGV
jgi:soluble cytochrome b562